MSLKEMMRKVMTEMPDFQDEPTRIVLFWPNQRALDLAKEMYPQADNRIQGRIPAISETSHER